MSPCWLPTLIKETLQRKLFVGPFCEWSGPQLGDQCSTVILDLYTVTECRLTVALSG